MSSTRRGLSRSRPPAVAAISVLVCLLLGNTWSREDPDAIVGVWSLASESGEVHVAIERGADGYAGTIVWLEAPLVPEDDPSGRGGRPKVDRENPDPALRQRPIIGLEILRGFAYDRRGHEWVDGRIYDPEQGKDYRCTLRLAPDGTLKVRGYVKLGFIKIGRTMDWRRVSGDQG